MPTSLSRKSSLSTDISISSEMLSWFRVHGRSLPWRKKKRNPYHTWISEIMLQQTQVKTMLPYYSEFLKTFPTVRDLAASEEDRVLELWQGLGYYSRARNLRKAAVFVCEELSGRIPATFEQLIRIPGIGPYTAGAIASLAFDGRVPIVDGNILRVFSRLMNSSAPIDRPSVRSDIEKIQHRSMPEKNCGLYNESLMELGALICTPKNPECTACPVRKKCKAFKAGTQDSIPKKQKKMKIEKVNAAAVILKKGSSYLIFRRPEKELMGGMWEFPEWKLESGTAPSFERLSEEIKPFSTDSLRPLHKIRRSYTRYHETLHVLEFTGDKLPKLKARTGGWKREWCHESRLLSKPLTSAHSKIRKLILER